MRRKTSAALFLVTPVILLLGSLAARAKPTETPVLSLPRHPHYVFQRVGDNFGLSSLRPGRLHLDRFPRRPPSL